MYRPDAVWLWDDSATGFVDLTNNVKTNSSITMLTDPSDRLYIGSSRRSVGFYCDLSTNGSYTGLSFDFIKPSNTWSKLSLIDSYSFNESKYLRWVMPEGWLKFNFTATSPHAGTPPDTYERYWFRISCSAVTTAAVISKLRVLPYATYTIPTEVSRFLQLKNDFGNLTNPSDLTVENYIRRAEDRIDYRTKKSWRFNVVTNENASPNLVDFNRFGFFLRHKNFFKVYSVKLWNGSDWDTLVEGRGSDYFVNYDLGMIYMTRMFLLPAIYGMMGRYTQLTFGEYKNAIKVDYAYGRDPESDTEFHIVDDIATRLAAIDVLRHHDYSSLVVSGTDKVPLESKIRLLEENSEMRLEELSSVSIY